MDKGGEASKGAGTVPEFVRLARAQIFWSGCSLSAWFKLLTSLRFRFHPAYLPEVLLATAMAGPNSLLRRVQERLYGRAVVATEMSAPPLFILGHWRSGTTYLHELLSLDERHTCPNTYECACPNHFLLTERCFLKRSGVLFNKRRPMDDVQITSDGPQEEELALCLLGLPSPYLDFIIRANPQRHQAYLDLESLPEAERTRWKNIYGKFLRQIHFLRPKRLILKSPLNTARIKILLEMFPEARFVHIVRNPFTVFLSMRHLCASLFPTLCLRRSRLEDLDERIFSMYLRMHERLQVGKKLLPGRFHEMRYEELVKDPVAQLQPLYLQLGLGDFEVFRPRLERHLEQAGAYKSNSYNLSPDVRDKIARRWGHIIKEYGYGPPLS